MTDDEYQELADIQVTQEEVIAGILFDRYVGDEVNEDMAQDIGRSALQSTVRNLTVEEFSALKEFLNG